MSIEEVFRALNKKGVRYLLVGGLASVLHGVPRTTMDIDIAIDPEKANLKNCISALKGIGMSSDTEHVDEILGQGGITFDNELSVDLLTDLPKGEDFEDLWKGRKVVEYQGIKLTVISKRDLRRILTKVGRKQDFEDLEYLKGPR